MNSNDNFQAIAALDLDPIKVKLMHQESGEGWSLEKVNAVEFEYRRFLYLMKIFPAEATAPLFDVDIFWHYHILDTMKYAQDCEQVFGYFLHHFPYIGLRGEEDLLAHQRVGERMKELYEETFGEDYIRAGAAIDAAPSAFSSATAKTAFSSAATKMAFSSATAKPAFSSAAVKMAFSSATAKTAFSSAAAQTAFSSATAKTAFSSAAVKTAFSSRAPATAFSSRAPAAQADQLSSAADRFYTDRPVLRPQS
ncbi:glycine-rich domain-containing protein-like [Janthinobacterium sp.]|uniref:glycine-rich domain-containing protein n=1 Tax=Janthinobacterium sp. TaxID=1871054 RepID=UPI00293D36A2|nr:glycine-rich domain-containing protein-like [Janthinobacterium sp.]